MEGIGSYRRVGIVAGMVLFLGAWMAGFYSFKAVVAAIAIAVVIWLVYVWSRDRVHDMRLYTEAFILGAFAVVVARFLGVIINWLIQGKAYNAPLENYTLPGEWLDFFRILLNGTFGQVIVAMLVSGAGAVLVTYLAALLESDTEEDDDETLEVLESEAAVASKSTEDKPEEKKSAAKAAPKFVEDGTELTVLHGMTSQFADSLRDNGVLTVEGLLDQASEPSDRKTLAQSSGIGIGRILRWVNLADLMRVKGIDAKRAHLLEKAGVDSVVELGVRSPERLMAKLEATNKTESIVDTVPELAVIQKWVERAKELPRKVNHDGGKK